MLLISRFYSKFRNNRYMEMAFNGLKPAIIGLIAAAALSLMNAQNFIDKNSFLIFAAVFVATIFKINPIRLIIISGLAGLVLY